MITAVSGGTPARLGGGDAAGATGPCCVPSRVCMAAGAKASSSSRSRAAGRPGSRGRMAGPVPSSAADTASRKGPAAAEGGSTTACRGRSGTLVRLIRARQALNGGLAR